MDKLTGGTPQTADDAVMARAEKAGVAVCGLINMMDGFDVLASSFTAPAVAYAWRLSPDEPMAVACPRRPSEAKLGAR